MSTRGRAAWLIVAALLATGCASARPREISEASARLPIGWFFANDAANFHYRISPDGTRLAWLASHGGRSAIHVREMPAGPVTVVDHGSPRALGNFTWAADSRHLLFLRDTDGDENLHVFLASLDAPAAPPRDVTPWAGARSWLHRVIVTDHAHVVIGSNRRDPSVYDLWRINLVTGEATLVADNPGDVAEWMTDWAGRPVARLRNAPEGARVLEAVRGETWAPLLTFDMEEMESRMLGVTGDGRGLWMLSNRNRERRALVRVDLATGAETVVHEDPQVDLDWVTLSQRTREPLAVFTNPDHPRARILHPPLAAAVERLLGSHPTGLQISSLDDEDRRVVLTTYTEQGYASWLVDGDGEPVNLGRSHTLARVEELGRTEPIAFDARDGLRLHGYLTRPARVTPPGPLVVMVHGGHWLRDYWGYSGPVQFLASRGYAVLQVNYRGSTGYGRRFLESAIGEYAGKMHDDLVDGVTWAVAQGIADPARVAIFGGSYGGYAALVGMTFTPGVFACGVSVVGISNLLSNFETVPPYWKLTWRPRMVRYMGDPATPEGRALLIARSPVFRADQVRGPLLLIHGARDARVKLAQSEEMAAALRRHDKPFRFIVLDDEGHSWSHGNWRNSIRHYQEIESFLDNCLAPSSAR
jgi:dipeptidyl aminopeptidase/acylaminoacyl peptidase